MIRVLADRHHGVLWEALAMLFVDRAILGKCELYAWADGDYVPKEGSLQSWPIVSDFPPRVVTAVSDDFIRSRKWDYVIATVSGTRSRLRQLADGLGATYVDHVGNVWDEPLGDTVLRSAVLPGGPKGIEYHPEFHRVPWQQPEGQRVGSFHAGFEHSHCRRWWDSVATPDFRMYGRSEDPLFPWEVAGAMRDCIAVWHCKDVDGYGFAVHEAFASGRLVIGHAEHYKGRFAGPLWESWTHVEPEVAPSVLSDPAAVIAYGTAARERFEELVDFDREAQTVAEYLGNARG